MSRYAVLIASIVFAGFAVPTWAGIYNSADDEKETPLGRNFEGVFVWTLGNLRSASAIKIPERESTLRKRYLLIEALGDKGSHDKLTLDQKLDYSAVLMRRGRADEAIEVLFPLTREHGENLLVQSHFATAHFLSSNAELNGKAAGFMRDCLSIWPERWEQLDDAQKRFLERRGWGEGIYEQNRKYEDYLYKLMKARKKMKPGEIALDPLFTDKDGKPVSFQNADGKYEIGRIPLAEKAKLPQDAIEIVEQLLVWMPNDLRLYWLLGEVYNASAMEKKEGFDRYKDIKAADHILKEIYSGLTNFQSGVREKDIPEELKKHHEVLAAYIAKTPPPQPAGFSEKEFKIDPNLIKDETPQEVSYRPMVVTFITGLAIGMFAIWQVQEMRRRRQARAANGSQ